MAQLEALRAQDEREALRERREALREHRKIAHEELERLAELRQHAQEKRELAREQRELAREKREELRERREELKDARERAREAREMAREERAEAAERREQTREARAEYFWKRRFGELPQTSLEDFNENSKANLNSSGIQAEKTQSLNPKKHPGSMAVSTNPSADVSTNPSADVKVKTAVKTSNVKRAPIAGISTSYCQDLEGCNTTGQSGWCNLSREVDKRSCGLQGPVCL